MGTRRMAKQLFCAILIVLSILTPVTSIIPGANLWSMETVAEAAEYGAQVSKQILAGYLPKYTGNKKNIVDALKAMGVDSSYTLRKYLAETNGISNYRGTAAQNTQLLNLLKKGSLKIYWRIRFTPLTKMVHNERPSFRIEFLGYGIRRVDYVSNSKWLLDVGLKNTQWKGAGASCFTTAYVKEVSFPYGTAKTEFKLYGGNSVSNAINNKVATYPIEFKVKLW